VELLDVHSLKNNSNKNVTTETGKAAWSSGKPRGM